MLSGPTGTAAVSRRRSLPVSFASASKASNSSVGEADSLQFCLISSSLLCVYMNTKGIHTYILHPHTSWHICVRLLSLFYKSILFHFSFTLIINYCAYAFDSNGVPKHLFASDPEERENENEKRKRTKDRVSLHARSESKFINSRAFSLPRRLRQSEASREDAVRKRSPRVSNGARLCSIFLIYWFVFE